MTTHQIISARILAHVANGMELRDAIDTVLGAGTYSRLAGEIYDTLREVA